MEIKCLFVHICLPYNGGNSFNPSVGFIVFLFVLYFNSTGGLLKQLTYVTHIGVRFTKRLCHLERYRLYKKFRIRTLLSRTIHCVTIHHLSIDEQKTY